GAFQIMTEFLTLMMDPYVYGRTGFGGADGFAPAAVYKEPVARRALAPFEQRWTVWGGRDGAPSRPTRDPHGVRPPDPSPRTGGGAAGLDYQLSPYTVVGFALGGGGTNWSVAQGLGSGHSDVFQAGVYGITNFGPAYLAGSFGYAEHWMRTNRDVFGETLATD